MFRLCLFLLGSLIFINKIAAQVITLNHQQQPIEHLLQELHEQHGWPISYQAHNLGACRIDLKGDYASPQLVLEAVADQCSLELRIVNDVFVFLPLTEPLSVSTSYLFKGMVLDKESQEPLPFATVRVNNTTTLIANENGRFSYQCKVDTAYVEVAHLGYYNLQQHYLINSNKEYVLYLQASTTSLEEILVHTQLPAKVSNGQEGTGISQLNAARLPFLPGNTTNSLFSYLRLQAGIMAAGEPEKDFILWGSYKGQTHLLYDGITLFSPTSYNNVLGMVNPAFVQAVEVHKGGQQVDIGDRAGGVVHLHSARGSLKKNHYEIGASSQLVDAYANIGWRDRGNLQVGMRFVLPHQWRTVLTGIEQQPFAFGDIHIKYSQLFSKGWSMKVSALANYDMSEKTRLKFLPSSLPRNLVEGRAQAFAGGSWQVFKDWKKGGQTRWQLSGSIIDFTYRPNWVYFGDVSESPYLFRNEYTKGMAEGRLRMDHRFAAACWHQLYLGVEAVVERAHLTHPLAVAIIPNLIQTGSRVQGYFKERFFILPTLTAEVGLRWTAPLWQQPTLWLQPRLLITYSPHQHWKLSWSIGNYQQFLTENSIIDRYNQHAYHWNIATNKETPVLESHHQVINLSYVRSHFRARLSGYYKRLDQLSRFRAGAGAPDYGKARSYGMDVQVGYQQTSYNLWMAYNLGRVEQSFCPRCSTREYEPALHDQRHELKIVGMYHWKFLTLSANYVFGSGLADPDTKERQPYSRLDAAILAKYSIGKTDWEAGISVLNILNTYNRPYLSYQTNSLYSTQATLHQGATVFLRAKF